MRAIRSIFTILISGLAMASCTTSGLEDLTAPDIANERVDLTIEGDIESVVSLESMTGLVDIYKATTPYFNENESHLEIKIDADHLLKIVLYSLGADDPLSTVTQFSSYPYQVIEDKQTYAIINYINTEGRALYSTTAQYAPPLLQPNVLEIINTNENGFSGRLRNVVLYEVHDGLRTEGNQSTSAKSIQITGSFKANDL